MKFVEFKEELNRFMDSMNDDFFRRFHFVKKQTLAVKYLDFLDDADNVEKDFYLAQRNFLASLVTGEYDLLSFHDADERKKAVYHLEDWVKIFPEINGVFESVKTNVKKYENSEFDDISFMVTRIDVKKTNEIVMFKIITPMQTVYKKNTIRKRRDKGYQKNKTNSFRIPQNFDFFIWSGKMFIVNIDAFERKFSEKLDSFRLREAESLLINIEQKNFLSKETCDQLLNYLKDDSKLTKDFLRAKKRLEFASKKINELSIVNHIKINFSGFKLIDEHSKIKLDQKKKAKNFVKLLADEILVSLLTGNQYNIKSSDFLK